MMNLNLKEVSKGAPRWKRSNNFILRIAKEKKERLTFFGNFAIFISLSI